jgi:hypothetical protein
MFLPAQLPGYFDADALIDPVIRTFSGRAFHALLFICSVSAGRMT